MTITTIEDVLLSVVDGLRLTGSVTNLVQDLVTTSIYTFTTDSALNLAVNKFIEFTNGKRGKVTNITGTTITIQVYYGNVPIVGTFKRLDPFFGQDLSKDIASKYATLGTDNAEGEYLKFPSIEIVRDKLESTENNYQFEEFSDVELIFVNETDKEWDGADRHTNNYKAVLNPLFDGFKEGLLRNGYLRKKQEITFKKSYLDKANYTGNKNALNHFVDILRVRISGLILDTNTVECSINL